MIETGFSPRVQIQDVIESQIPEFILSENPKFSEFLKQYYISQEYQGGPVDIVENLDQYINLNRLIPEVITDTVELTSDINSTQTTIEVSSTKGFPETYGLFKVDDEIITYTSKNSSSFIGCVRGFSGITGYDSGMNNGELIFSESSAQSHTNQSEVTNLSSIFLQEFYKKLKYSFTPGLEGYDFDSNLNVGNFIKEAKTFYETKGTEEAFRILFGVLYGETPNLVDLEQYLIKPSSANHLRRQVILTELISGDPLSLEGQQIYKNTDSNTYATVSEVDILKRGTKQFFKMLLFSGYDDTFPPVFGNFVITGTTKTTDSSSIGASTLTVDTTIGFPESGVLNVGNNVVTYSSKSINQFFGCSGIVEEVEVASTITSNDTYYGYENGDITKKVTFRITGIISNYESITKNAPLSVGEEINVKSIGEKILNPLSNKSKKEIFANSWIYNTSSRFKIDSFDPGLISQVRLKSNIDKSRLKDGDSVDILSRDSQSIVVSDAKIISVFGNQISLSKTFTLNSSFEYDVRKKVNYASSSNVNLEFPKIISDIQNVYSENSEYMYVASNSLPSYEITAPLYSYNVSELLEYNNLTGQYSTLKFNNDVSFITGSEVVYRASGSPIGGLNEGTYFVQVLTSNTIRLYPSLSSIGSGDYLKYVSLPAGEHNFTLLSQKEKVLSAQKLLKKFPLSVNIGDGESDLTSPGSIGMLIDGVEVYSYKSNDKIYYGPLSSVDVLNGGVDYDVINPPILSPKFGNALVQPIVRGEVKETFIDPLDFDINSIVSITFSGGNGTGASFEPVIENTRREISFNANQASQGGGVDVDTDVLTFSSEHKLSNGESVLYDPGNYSSIGIGTYLGGNENTGKTLVKDSEYFVQVLSSTSVLLFEKFGDFSAGINTVGFTTIGTSGIQKFLTKPKRRLVGLEVLNSGEGYENRLLRVSASGISTATNKITFTDHGFSDGELISYDYQNSPISGLSTEKQYYILKIDDDSFSLADAGIGATISSNFNKRKPVGFNDFGSGYQTFKYPDISLNVEFTAVGVGSTIFTGNINATPVVRGEIIDTYVYDGGSNIGSTILNYENNPDIEIKNGKDAIISPIIINGQIRDIFIQYSGTEYNSEPTIKANGDGSGAKFRPVIENGKIVNVIVINTGSGYSSNTTITVESAGKNAVLKSNVRSLSVNNNIQFKDATNTKVEASELLISTPNNNIQYAICGYSDILVNNFNDDASEHSPLIGWAYDGNPIYGSYGYSDPSDINSSVKKLVSGYTKSLSNVHNRPPSFVLGFFEEDYTYDASGDLDEYNGRFCLTPEFPNGTYAYFATSSIDGDGNIIGVFPYFIGNRYRSAILPENTSLSQNFDFNKSKLLRNTFPHGVNEEFIDNDFITESNEGFNQLVKIDSVSEGSIDKIAVVSSGSGYQVDDILKFDEEISKGQGLYVKVSELEGKLINSLETTITSFENVVITKKDDETIEVKISPYHNLENLDNVIISGLSTIATEISGYYQINVNSPTSTLVGNISSESNQVIDILSSRIPESISIGSSIGIGTESFTILNIFEDLNVIRASRQFTSIAHTAPLPINFVPDKFTVSKKSDFFESSYNDLIYFNPQNSIGIGTTPGAGIGVTYNIGIQTNHVVSIPTQSIYLPNHPFKTNQAVILSKPTTASVIGVANTPSSGSFNIPESGDTQTVYVIRKSHDYIGIVTQIGLTTTTNGLYFTSNATDDFAYSLESNYLQSLATVEKVSTLVSLSTSHMMQNGDTISLTVEPNISVGIGTSTAVRVKYDSLTEKLLINPIEFSSAGINTITNKISISDHNLKTGEKVVYASENPAVGLSTGTYFVYRVDDNNIHLCETKIDSLSNPPIVVGITTAPTATHEISLVNPPITVIKNNDIVFDLSDSSLRGYDFKLYYDETFKDEFVSTGSTNQFSVVGIDTVGFSTASITVKYDSLISDLSPLFYNIEKSGYISTADTNIDNYSQIRYEESHLNGSYRINNVESDTFIISHPIKPEKLSYTKSECDTLSYKTNSKTEFGGIENLSIISSGFGYESIPQFISTETGSGIGAELKLSSDTIGEVNQINIVSEGFDYSSDLTLRPTAKVPTQLISNNSNIVESIDVFDGGKNFIEEPGLVLIEKDTGKLIESGLITPNISGNSLISVNIESPPKGVLNGSLLDVRTINNSNGVAITLHEASTSGIVTCTLATPLSGFSVEPFAVGDKIYVEGLEKHTSVGDGFNSDDYGYVFFTVTSYSNGGTIIPRKLEFDLSSYTTNPGIALTSGTYGTIINYNNYPKFTVNTRFAEFLTNETVEVKQNDSFTGTDAKIVIVNGNSIKVSGNYIFEIGDTIRGAQSGSIATINEINISEGVFNIDFSFEKSFGWRDETGKLNNDTQVIEDNDYYQNLSYTVKTKQTWENIVSPVNSLLHPTGLKNFADTEILQPSGVVATSSSESTIYIHDIFSENRVDTVNNFDLVRDTDVNNSTSKFLEFDKEKLTDYVEIRSNRVLEIDDISDEFSNNNLDIDDEVNLTAINANKQFSKFLVQIASKDYSQVQFSEVLVLNNNSGDIYTLQKGNISNTEDIIGEVTGATNNQNELFLRFSPEEVYNTSYNIKHLDTSFTNFVTGISTFSIGFIDLIGVTTTVSSGSTASILIKDTSQTKAVHTYAHVLNNSTNEMNYVELLVDHDGQNTNISEFYFDTDESDFSGGGSFIGSFGASISNGILTFDYTNNSDDSVTIRTKNVGFGTTASGIGTYRFSKLGQPEGDEKTVTFDSNYANTSIASTTIQPFDISEFNSIKSTLRVSIGQTSALHQLMVLTDTFSSNKDVHIIQYPFLSIGSTSGIGTFGVEISGGGYDGELKFYPDSQYVGTENIEILSFSENFHHDFDDNNLPEDLEFGNIQETMKLSKFISINDEDVFKDSFDLTYDGIPIFMKTFDPGDNSVLNITQDEYTLNISDHFFSSGEELKYRPKSSFTTVSPDAIGIVTTQNHLGVNTTLLPSTVYAIKVNNGKLKLATTKENALSGIAITFNSIGSGNAHELEMSTTDSKSLISIDGLIQDPISYSLLSYSNVSGSIGVGDSIIHLSGISSIRLSDLLKVDDEYIKVLNVGLGTTSTGPISFGGTFPLINVERGIAGTLATSHVQNSAMDLYRGSYTINENKIHFTDAPVGVLEDQIFEDTDNLPEGRSRFFGRTFLRLNYDSNQIFDNISDTFTGLDQRYTLTSGGINTVGLGTSGGAGIVVINGVYQAPTTDNNQNNNFNIEEESSIGISSIVFTGITSANGSIVISDDDVNQNELPRGGIIVSLGSTPGLGYAPLVGASVTAIISAGSIVSIGIGTTGNWGSGYREPVSIAVTDSSHSGNEASITASVGAGGSLAFTINDGGTGYSNPKIDIEPPLYSNLEVIGHSRIGIGTTTDTGFGMLLDIDVSAASTTGIGSTLFQVSKFSISRKGYGFKKGDVIRAVGLVTASGLSEPVEHFELTVLDTFTDNFSAWQFGQIDYIDPIDNFQDGVRTRFDLKYDGDLVSFEKNRSNPDSQVIDYGPLLLVFLNGILQQPNIAYTFEGGTSVTFTNPPKTNDKVSIFFYRGSENDSSVVVGNEIVKVGDDLKVFSKNNLPGITTTQDDSRIITRVAGFDLVQTNLYLGDGIDSNIFKPTSWTKQKSDKVLEGHVVSKARDSIETQIYPTAKVIDYLNSTDVEIFVDNAEFFNYEDPGSIDFDCVVLPFNPDPVAAGLSAVVSAAGTIQSLLILEPGSGYVGSSLTVSISSPPIIGSGIGSTATATVSIVNGSINSSTIVEQGLGYSQTNPPQVLVPTPSPTYENITGITNVEGFSGGIVGIATTSGIDTDLAITFELDGSLSPFAGLSTNYRIYINNTKVGTGVTSILDTDTEIVGIGTQCLDNVYNISGYDASAGIITCNVQSSTNIVGIATTGTIDNPVATFSWGRLSGFSRGSSPISIGVSGHNVQSGLSTFPTIQRRGYGLRSLGALSKVI